MSRSQAGTLAISCFSRRCGIKYLPRRNKSYVAVRSHLGGNRRIPESQRYRRSLSLLEHPPARSNIPRRRPISTFFSATPWRLSGNNFCICEPGDRMCTARVIYDGDVVTSRRRTRLSRLLKRREGRNDGVVGCRLKIFATMRDNRGRNTTRQLYRRITQLYVTNDGFR